MEFALSLPPTWHIRDGWKRRPFRDATKGILPELVRWRHNKLAPYPGSVMGLAARKAELQQRAEEALQSPAVRSLFDPKSLRSLLASIPDVKTTRPSRVVESTVSIVVAYDALKTAIYVEQHSA